MLVIKYGLFALIATLVNLTSQYMTFELIDSLEMFRALREYSLVIGILVGTATGLVTKYVLDKKYIFHYKPDGAKDDAKTFFMYTVVGILTTCLFWGFEVLFDYLLNTPFARYIGAIVGLSIGYTSKYFLDKRFVFNQEIYETT